MSMNSDELDSKMRRLLTELGVVVEGEIAAVTVVLQTFSEVQDHPDPDTVALESQVIYYGDTHNQHVAFHSARDLIDKALDQDHNFDPSQN